MLRFLVADDHPGIRRCVGETLESEQGWTVCGVAATGRQAVAMTATLNPDFVVIDICMPELDGLQATRQIRAQFPQTGVLILTMHDTPELLNEVRSCGASACILKTDLHRLPDVVRTICEERNLKQLQGPRFV